MRIPGNYPPIRAVTFDLDDTLWAIWPIIARAEQQLHDWLVQHYPLIPERFSALALRHMAEKVARDRPDIAHDRSELRREALRRAAREAGYEGFRVDDAFEVFLAARNEVVFFEEVMPVLERLAARFTLGALSNGNADIDSVGLGDLFDFSFNAIIVGAAKPAPDMFVEACRYLGLEPAQIVHVGDDPEHDVLGAARVGLRTVWVNRDGREWPGDQRADGEIRTLEELEALLQVWA